MRCPDCNKFVSLETQEPEVSDLAVTHNEPEDAAGEHTFTITGSVRIVRNCGECSNELKEATLEIEQEAELGEGVSANIAADYRSRTDLDDAEVEESGVDIIEEGGGRYAKSYYGASVTLDVRLGGMVIASVQWSDKIAASAMDELV